MAGTGDGYARLSAVASLVGVQIDVTDAAEWHLDAGRLRVGLGWYAARGHGVAEAEALAMLQLWESVRAERMAPERARRRRSIARSQPETVPLLDAVIRLQAASELLAAMPAMQSRLRAAIRRSVPDDLGAWPRHLQWVAVILLAGLGAGEPDGSDLTRAGLDDAVLAEWTVLRGLGDADFDPLRRVFAPDPARTPLRRLERALALLLPSYERLLLRDVSERGWGGRHGPRSDETGDGGETFGDAAGGSGDEGADDAPEHASDADDAQRDASAEDDKETARKGDGQDTAEGADLFAAEQAGFVQTVLSTPLPNDGALIEALLKQLPDAPPEGEARAAEGAGTPAAQGGNGLTGIAEYRARVEELNDAIERMRAVWARVLAERIGPKRALSRAARPEGETLATESVAQAVAAARSGVPRPRAYRSREHRQKRTRRAGSTDYVLVIDRSASMSGPAAQAAADAVLIMTEALAGVERDIAHAEAAAGFGLDLDIRTSLIVFAAEAAVVKPLSRGLDDDVRRAIHAATRAPSGSTNDAAALRAAADQLGIGPGTERRAADGMHRRRLVILVGDGGTSDPTAATRELRRLRQAGVGVHGIGIANDDIVVRYAPTGRRIDDADALAEALQDLIADELP